MSSNIRDAALFADSRRAEKTNGFMD